MCGDAEEQGKTYGSLARSHEQVTILFMDIVGFTTMSKSVASAAVLDFLNRLFTLYDGLCDKHNVHKVETAGDCYIVSCGIMERDENDGFVKVSTKHDPSKSAANVLGFAKDMLRISKLVNMPHNSKPVTVRIGMHTGSVVSGVIGTKLPKYSVFGDTMNMASRMESTANHGGIQVSADTYSLLQSAGSTDTWKPTGGIEVKGKGIMETFHIEIDEEILDVNALKIARKQYGISLPWDSQGQGGHRQYGQFAAHWYSLRQDRLPSSLQKCVPHATPLPRNLRYRSAASMNYLQIVGLTPSEKGFPAARPMECPFRQQGCAVWSRSFFPSRHAQRLHASVPDTGIHLTEPSAELDPGLYLDITLRALTVLKSADLVLAEDTRHTRKLLNHFDIKVIALVSDAGTPAISDPGYLLVKAAIEAGVTVIPIPGACAVTTALIGSGLSTDSFTFCGFLPPKQGARRNRLSELRGVTSTLIFYTPPHGLVATLGDMIAVLGGQRQVCVARELTKIHEEFFRSTLDEALAEFTARNPRGEIVLVVEGYHHDSGVSVASLVTSTLPDAEQSEDSSQVNGGDASSSGGAVEVAPSPEESVEKLLEGLIRGGKAPSAAAKDVASGLGLKRKEVYALAVKVFQEMEANELHS
eukprot:gene12586-15810_t